MLGKEVYLDNAATTKVDEKVIKEINKYFSIHYGNPSSKHVKGGEAKTAINRSRKIISKSIGAKPEEIFFTSGGTESNNWALKGLFFWHKKNTRKNHIVTTKIEHDCVLNACKWIEGQGGKVTYLDVDKEGYVDLNELKKTITKKTFLVSVIHGNNEIGTVQNLGEIGKVCREKNVLFHTDACQSFTKVDLDVDKHNLDLVSLNSHKIHGPKGVGALYVRKSVDIFPLMHGGGQEKGMRSGTENVPGIVGFAKAVELSNKKDVEKIRKLRDKFIEGLLKNEGVKLNGPRERLPNNVNACFSGIEGEVLAGYLEDAGIYTSAGSACLSNSNDISHVLKAIGLSEKDAESSLRFSLSKYTTDKDVDYVVRKISKILNKFRNISK